MVKETPQALTCPGSSISALDGSWSCAVVAERALPPTRGLQGSGMDVLGLQSWAHLCDQCSRKRAPCRAVSVLQFPGVVVHREARLQHLL